jgi:23S rRNA (cytidine1920-2'-O)/16S rRNA (cytidine1409-2'-O)-methyltransferase
MAARTALRLDEAVAVAAGVTRSRARALIMAGRVRVDGRPMTKPGWGVASAASLVVERPRPYVGRGGEKLEGALAAFALDVRDARALDVGASTGGFTDCLLAHGAAHVVALDVGYGQLAYSLRVDPRVTVVERCNFRLLPDAAFAREFDAIVFDASFVSVIPLLARARAFLKDGARMVALVKPQFEAGRERVRGGVVRDPAVHREVLATVRARTLELGIVPVALTRSPLRGPAGNVEFFILIASHGAPFGDDALDATVAAAE